MIRWEPITGQRGAVCHDIPGTGRYSVRRQRKGSRLWVVVLNGRELGLFNDRLTAVEAAELYVKEMTDG
jgi:hypothetical protein